MKKEYRHVKSGKVYEILFPVKIQIGQKWIDGICYTDGENRYVRERGDFFEKFVALKESDENAND
jgi:hypothetical protein